MGELELPLPVLIPTRLRQRGSTAHHRGSTAWAEVPHQSGSTAFPGSSKKLLPRWGGSTVLSTSGSTVAGCGSTAAGRGSTVNSSHCKFHHEKKAIARKLFTHKKPQEHAQTRGKKTTRNHQATKPLEERGQWPKPPMFELDGMAPRRIILGPMTKTRL